MTAPEMPDDGSTTRGAALRRELSVPFEPHGTNLEGYDPRATPFESSKKRAVRQLDEELRPALFDAHELLMAHADRRVVLVLQGLDASGKSGTIKHVVSAMNPVGIRVTSFKEPTGVEEAEPFLARIERALPEPGELAVFDRSHYEDAIVPAVRERESDDMVDARVDAIRRFEDDLVADGVVIVKFLLNVSYDEQRERFLSRLREPDKRWKFSEADLETRRSWSHFVAAYGAVIGRTSTEHARWHVVPADRKWYRNWAVAQILLDSLRGLHDELPRSDLDVAALEARLAPPN